MSNIIEFERRRPPVKRDLSTSIIDVWLGVCLMQIAALSMIAHLWDDR